MRRRATTSPLAPSARGSSRASSVIASGFDTSSLRSIRAALLTEASGRAPRTVMRGGSSGLGRSSSTLRSTQVPSRAHCWKGSTRPSSKQDAENCPLLSEKSAAMKSLPFLVLRRFTPSTSAAMTAPVRAAPAPRPHSSGCHRCARHWPRPPSRNSLHRDGQRNRTRNSRVLAAMLFGSRSMQARFSATAGLRQPHRSSAPNNRRLPA